MSFTDSPTTPTPHITRAPQVGANIQHRGYSNRSWASVSVGSRVETRVGKRCNGHVISVCRGVVSHAQVLHQANVRCVVDTRNQKLARQSELRVVMVIMEGRRGVAAASSRVP